MFVSIFINALHIRISHIHTHMKTVTNCYVSDTPSQSAGDLSSDRTVMYNAYAGVATVKSEVKEETDTDSDVKPAPLHCVDAGVYWV
jgi:hypothetical protein